MNQLFASRIIPYFELLAGLVGVYYYSKSRNSIWFWFACFLICLFGFEQVSVWFAINKKYEQNTQLFKWIVVPLWITMYHFIFYRMASKKIKIFALASLFIFLLLTLVENFFIGDVHFYTNSIALSYACLAILFFCMHYFLVLVKGNDLLIFKQLMPFWFCLGVLIFFLGSFPYLTFFNSMAISKNENVAVIYRWIFIILNYIMYLLFTIGFIWSKPKQ